MIKKIGIVTITLLAFFGIISVQATNYLDGKIIALDAGHGGIYNGAINENQEELVTEKDVNLAVVYELKERLEDDGAIVVLTRVGDDSILSRRDRTAIAEKKCLEVEVNGEVGHKCDVLLSVHHNGSIDPDHNGTLVIYNERQDLALATTLHNRLVDLTDEDEGYLHGGYGITVFDHFVSALTEAYYITNDIEAETYLSGELKEVYDGYEVRFGPRITEEVNFLYLGLNDYFSVPQKVIGRNR